MKLPIAEATDLAVRALTRAGMSAPSARIVADHLVDANLCGHEFSSLARVVAIVDELSRKTAPREIRVVREDRSSAVIDGGDNVAYVVSLAAIDKAVAICRKHGVAVVVAHNTWAARFRSQGHTNPTPRIRMLDGFNSGWIAFQGTFSVKKTRPVAGSTSQLFDTGTELAVEGSPTE